jgi:nitric oxide reductase activation protein
LFKNVDRDDYHLDTLSVAEQKAKPIAGFDFDLDGVPRDAQKPDIGAYEYKPK